MKTRLVCDVMTKDVVSVRTYTPFRVVAATMLGRNLGAVPVVDTEGHPLGVVSRTDLIAKRAHLGRGRARCGLGTDDPRGRRTSEPPQRRHGHPPDVAPRR